MRRIVLFWCIIRSNNNSKNIYKVNIQLKIIDTKSPKYEQRDKLNILYKPSQYTGLESTVVHTKDLTEKSFLLYQYFKFFQLT